MAVHLAKRHEIVLDVGTSNALWPMHLCVAITCDRWASVDAGDECPAGVTKEGLSGNGDQSA